MSMAYAGAEFADKVIKAIKGEKGIVAPSFVNLAANKEGGEALKKEIGRELDFFSAPVELGVRTVFWWRLHVHCEYDTDLDMILLQPEGVKSIKPIGKVTPFEQKLIEAAIPELETNIEKVRSIPYPLVF